MLNKVILTERSESYDTLVSETTLTSAGSTSAVWSVGSLTGDAATFCLYWYCSGTGDDVDGTPDMKFTCVNSPTSANWHYPYDNSNSRQTIITSMGEVGYRYYNLSGVLRPTPWVKFKFEVNTDGPDVKFSCGLFRQV